MHPQSLGKNYRTATKFRRASSAREVNDTTGAIYSKSAQDREIRRIIVEEEKRSDFTALVGLIRAAYKFFVNLEPSYEDHPFETGSGRDLYM